MTSYLDMSKPERVEFRKVMEAVIEKHLNPRMGRYATTAQIKAATRKLADAAIANERRGRTNEAS